MICMTLPDAHLVRVPEDRTGLDADQQPVVYNVMWLLDVTFRLS